MVVGDIRTLSDHGHAEGALYVDDSKEPYGSLRGISGPKCSNFRSPLAQYFSVVLVSTVLLECRTSDIVNKSMQAQLQQPRWETSATMLWLERDKVSNTGGQSSTASNQSKQEKQKETG